MSQCKTQRILNSTLSNLIVFGICVGICINLTACNPASGVSVTEASATEASDTEAPATATLEAETSATEAPVTETSDTEAPVTEAPVTETPATEAPDTEQSATEAPVTATPVTETPVTTNSEYPELVQKLAEEIARKEFPGSIVIATDDEIIYASGTDALQFDGQVVSPNTTYQIGSVSKVFTATCILKLMEEGKVAPEDKMEKFFPEYVNIKDVTIDNLLHMTSGIADFVNYPDKAFPEEIEAFYNDAMAEAIDDAKMHEYMKNIQIICEPGSKYEYSNTNYYLLARIVETVTGGILRRIS